jgi:hypothetical protein
VTLVPTLTACPITSWPTQMGSGTLPQPPVMVWTSEPQTPQHSILISMSLSPNFLGLNWRHIRVSGWPRLSCRGPDLLLGEFGPFLLIRDHKALEGIWVDHCVWYFSCIRNVEGQLQSVRWCGLMNEFEGLGVKKPQRVEIYFYRCDSHR